LNLRIFPPGITGQAPGIAEYVETIMEIVLRCFTGIAHDRRGHGGSSQPPQGNDMDTHADAVAALTQALDLKNAKIVKCATLKVYKGVPHGMCTTHRNEVNEDLVSVIRS
jgi:alpha-beta hydrolase superfamily lysophospholipase